MKYIIYIITLVGAIIFLVGLFSGKDMLRAIGLAVTLLSSIIASIYNLIISKKKK